MIYECIPLCTSFLVASMQIKCLQMIHIYKIINMSANASYLQDNKFSLEFLEDKKKFKDFISKFKHQYLASFSKKDYKAKKIQKLFY